MMEKNLIIFLILILMYSSINAQIIQATLDFLQRGSQDMYLESMNDAPLDKEYDFIIVGAGTAGCAVAARLSENPKWKVLLLEAGRGESLIMDIPILVHFLQLGTINWKYRTQPSNSSCLAMKNNRCNWPRGKVMGGSSVLNYMMYTRGNRRDYDRWAELGNVGWSYKEILPYFKKLEDSSVPDADPDYVGRGGPVGVSYVDWRSKIADAFVEAGQQDGLKRRDYNGKIQVGISQLHTTTRNATRMSSNRAYLYPIKGQRPNLHIKKFAHVTKVIIDPNTKIANGVIVFINGQYIKIRARKEVILSAGAINTPQLLMLSGIGPAAHLREKNIKPIADLAVGFNLQDHQAPAVTFLTNATSLHFDDFAELSYFEAFTHRTGIYGSPGGCESIAFYALDDPKNPDGWPDIELFLVGGSVAASPAISQAFGLKQSIYRALFKEIEDKRMNAFMIFPMILRPKSRGRIMLKNNDPFTYPLIYANYYSHPYDMDIIVRGIKKSISLMDKPAMKAINGRLLNRMLPGCKNFIFNTDKYWECYARHFTFTIYHYSGTAKMGPDSDKEAVVDPRLRVKGVKNLRVIDASIFPEIMSGHPNGPVFMIAEKGADMIKQDHGFIS